MLFDGERKGPSEFNTRGVIIALLCAYQSSAIESIALTSLVAHLSFPPRAELVSRARALLSYLADPQAPEESRPVGFILQMHSPRPYQLWCREMSNVSKEIFWIFLHHLNVVPLSRTGGESQTPETYTKRHFPKERPPVPAAPYVGGVEWDATNYLASHLDLLNGIIASLSTRKERNALRAELRASGLETIMGGTLRLCKEKFYGMVQDGLRTWVEAAAEDGWDVAEVRNGPHEKAASPRKSPQKSVQPKQGTRTQNPPKIELPKLDFDLGLDQLQKQDDDWL